MKFVFSAPERPSVAIANLDARFPVHRIYCVGRNYAAHAKEMGKDPDREPPFFFDKPADAVVANGFPVPYPPRTQNLHYEVELVVALAHEAKQVRTEEASDLIFGYAIGNDLTRRDLQFAARDAGRPWDVGKGFDQSAPISSIYPVTDVGHLKRGRIWLTLNGDVRQDADLADLIWNVDELVSELSTLFTLRPGDLIFTGTPSGVGPVEPGDRMEAGIDSLGTLVTPIE